MARILLLNGPNLNLLGTREPHLYGVTTLSEVVGRCQVVAAELGHSLEAFQSNAEGALLDAIQQAPTQGIDLAVINPAGLSHTSVALRDAFLAVGLPFVEVHLSNIFARESFRQHSFLSDIALGVISGLGPAGYEWAIRSGSQYLADSSS